MKPTICISCQTELTEADGENPPSAANPNQCIYCASNISREVAPPLKVSGWQPTRGRWDEEVKP